MRAIRRLQKLSQFKRNKRAKHNGELCYYLQFVYVCLGLKKTIELLIANGANVNAVNGKGNTPLLFATRKGNELIE